MTSIPPLTLYQVDRVPITGTATLKRWGRYPDSVATNMADGSYEVDVFQCDIQINEDELPIITPRNKDPRPMTFLEYIKANLRPVK